VYRAVDINTNPPQNVAIKVIGPLDGDDLVDVFFAREVEALRSLQHPNIVTMLDAGRDDQSGDSYVALEWVESDLLRLLEAGPIPFDDFVGQIALPLASALAAAHERHVIHRDVKPSNVLIDRLGTPKLADFGISKIKSSLTSSPHTTAQFASRPYAPPEHESTSSYTRDVYGFGVLMLRCLVDCRIEDYPDIKPAIESLDATPELATLIERCVDFDPAQRPTNGSLLYAELNALHEKRQSAAGPGAAVYLAAGPTARDWCTETLEIDERQVERYIVEDLADAPAIKPLSTADEAMGEIHDRQYFLYGSSLSYRVVVQSDGARPPSLFIMSAIKPDQVQLDKSRDNCFILKDAEFRFGTPLNHVEAAAALADLARLADEFVASQQLMASEREERRLLDEWRRQILARDSIESGKEFPARYEKAEIDGRRVRLTITEGLINITQGEIRRLEVGDGRRRGPLVRGEVERIRDNVVTIYLESDPETIPVRGQAVVDTSAARIKIDREKSALSELIYGSREIVRDDLRDLIVHPDAARKPVPAEIEAWFQKDLDVDKRDAVGAALGCEDLFLVQGPPGTGKTTFISELVAQELRRNPRAIILIASQTNVALDNALVRISRLGLDARLIRLADAKASRVSTDAAEFLLDRQMEAWSADVAIRSQAFLDEWCSIHGVARETVRLALELQELADLKRAILRLDEMIGEVKVALEEADSSGNPVQRDAEIADLTEHRDDLRAQLRTLRRDADALWTKLSAAPECAGLTDESAEHDLVAASSALLAAAGDRADELRAFVRVQAEWLQRLGKGDEFVEPLLLGSQVLGATCVGMARYRALKSAEFDLCIIDEASKATATEALVPMVRSQRWVLVGDQQQLPPFQEEALREAQIQADFDLDANELRRTLFDRLADGLAPENRIMLKTQRRMTKAIGDLISECFYGGELLSAGPSPLGPISRVLPRAVTWLSTSRIPSRHEQVDHFETTSYVNLEEAREVVAVLRRISRWYRPGADGKPLHVLILAPYRAQVAQLRHRVAGVEPDVQNLMIEVNTIDAVQGREATLVIFSVTRSNPENKLGFLNVEARANVAMSRAQRGLIIVGDAEFCQSKPGPLRDILAHIDRHPAECVVEEVKP
jgi:hypothetical protein